MLLAKKMALEGRRGGGRQCGSAGLSRWNATTGRRTYEMIDARNAVVLPKLDIGTVRI